MTALLALDAALRVGYRTGSLGTPPFLTPEAVRVLELVVSILSLTDAAVSFGLKKLEERQRWPDREGIQYAGKKPLLALCCHERMITEGAHAVTFKPQTTVDEVDTAFGISDLTVLDRLGYLPNTLQECLLPPPLRRLRSPQDEEMDAIGPRDES